MTTAHSLREAREAYTMSAHPSDRVKLQDAVMAAQDSIQKHIGSTGHGYPVLSIDAPADVRATWDELMNIQDSFETLFEEFE